MAGLISRAEAAVAAREFDEAIAKLERAEETGTVEDPDLKLRALLAGAAARSELGRLEEALSLLEAARDLVEGDSFTDVDRANVLFHIGQGRYRLSSIPTATAIFTEALELMRHADAIDDRLRCRILRWRSRCYRRQSDWEAARRDVEAALELSERLGDGEALAHGYFQASIIAERKGQWVLARSYAERAKALYEEQEDRLNVGRLLNNLGGLAFLLGDSERAAELLKEAFAVALEVGSKPDAAQAVSSLAQVQPAHRPSRAGRGAGTAGAEPARRQGRLPRRAGKRPARARPRAARAGQARRVRAGARRRRGRVRAALVAEPPRRGVDRAGRPERPPRRQGHRAEAVPPRNRGTPGLQLLMTRRLAPILLAALVLAGAGGRRGAGAGDRALDPVLAEPFDAGSRATCPRG